MGVVKNCKAKALGCCGMTMAIMVRATIVVNSPWPSSECLHCLEGKSTYYHGRTTYHDYAECTIVVVK